MSNLRNVINNLPDTPRSLKVTKTEVLDKFQKVPANTADLVAERMRASGDLPQEVASETVSSQVDVGSTPVSDVPGNPTTEPTKPAEVKVEAAVVEVEPKVEKEEAEPKIENVETIEKLETPVSFLADITANVSLATGSSPETSHLLKQLGLNANRDTKLLQLAKTNSRPLSPKPVIDNSGRISDIINDFQREYGIVVVPRKITNIPEWVTPRDHYVFEFEKEFFFAPRDVEVVSTQIQKLIAEVLAKLDTGALVSKDLIQTFQCKGESVRTLLLSQEGLAEVTTLLSNYGTTVVSAGEWSLSLVVGDYIQVK